MTNQERAQFVKDNFSKVSTEGAVRLEMELLYLDTFDKIWKADCAACIKRGYGELMSFYNL